MENLSIITIEDASNVYFTSDTHFGHANIMRLCNRPFKTIGEMNDTLVRKWNEVVPEDGLVFHLGDFAYGPSGLWDDLLSQLNGRIVLILGNHDLQSLGEQYMSRFEAIAAQMTMNIEGRKVIMNHYPFLTYSGVYHNGKSRVWQLHVHIHSGSMRNNGRDKDRIPLLLPTQYDVGVDNNDFKPVSWAHISSIITSQVERDRGLVTKNSE